MTTRTFDGSSGHLPDGQFDDTPAAVPGGDPAYQSEPKSSGSSLDMLFDALSQREREAEKLFPVEIPGLDVRIMCSLDIQYADWKDMQIKAIPREKRKKPNPLDINQRTLCLLVLQHTAQHLEIRRQSNGEWMAITDDHGEVVPFGGDAMLRRFGQMDVASLVDKLFDGNDGHILRAGTRVINASGYGDEADEKEALEVDAPLG